MPGLYLHIPFCKQACHYCNFHFSTSLKYRSEMVHAIIREIELQKDYLQDKNLETIYFGGGTPSLLTSAELDAIFETIKIHFNINDATEITLEANPDDLTSTYLSALSSSPINRLSIGIQSFADDDLKYMNRSHDAAEAIACIDEARSYGFEKLSVDLIYGTPGMSDAQWNLNLDTLQKLDINHISAYALTVEPETALAHFIKTGKSKAPLEKQAARQFEQLMAWAKLNNIVHYEISNFGRENHFAIHNTNYWKGVHYLGIGPSAHSFNGVSRQWNIAHNMKYMEAIKSGKVLLETENLSSADQYNESVMTGLRTIWGCDDATLEKHGPTYSEYFYKNIKPHVEKGHVIRQENSFVLTQTGKLLADKIASDLFWVED